jgi:hypothetical protein
LLEFACILIKVDIPIEDLQSEPKLIRRPKNGVFSFQESHPQYKTKELRLSTKQGVPMLIGRNIPTFPTSNDPKKNEIEANLWAMYFLAVVLIPWSTQLKKPNIDLTYESYVTWLNGIHQDDTINHNRMQYLQSCKDTTYTNRTERFAHKKMRSRCASTKNDYISSLKNINQLKQFEHDENAEEDCIEKQPASVENKIKNIINILRAQFESKQTESAPLQK